MQEGWIFVSGQGLSGHCWERVLQCEDLSPSGRPHRFNVYICLPEFQTTLGDNTLLTSPSDPSIKSKSPAFWAVCQPLPFISTLLSMQISTNPIIKPLEAGNGSTVYWGLPTPPRDCIASSGLTVLALHWLTKATFWNIFSISVGEDEHNSYPIIDIVTSFSTSVTMSHLLLN